MGDAEPDQEALLAKILSDWSDFGKWVKQSTFHHPFCVSVCVLTHSCMDISL